RNTVRTDPLQPGQCGARHLHLHRQSDWAAGQVAGRNSHQGRRADPRDRRRAALPGHPDQRRRRQHHRRRHRGPRFADGVLAVFGAAELHSRRDQPGAPAAVRRRAHCYRAVREAAQRDAVGPRQSRCGAGELPQTDAGNLRSPGSGGRLHAVDGDRRRGQPDPAFPVGRRQTVTTGLGMPAAPAPTLAPRRKTRQLMVRDVGGGSDYPISVQSMCTTKTHDINSTLQQIAELTATGCDIVRVACPRQEDADALPAIAKKSQIPVIADIHFQPKYIFAAIDAGCAAVRVNPGNIKEFDGRVGEVAKAAGEAGIPIRIGVNAGSLDKRFMEKYGKATPEALVESALWEASLFEDHGFGNIKISVKHNDPVVMVAAYEQLAARCDYPLHLGVTEAGPAFQGTIKSAVAFGALLSRGIGDTIRVSLSAPPVE